jgi:hypothetical protein
VSDRPEILDLPIHEVGPGDHMDEGLSVVEMNFWSDGRVVVVLATATAVPIYSDETYEGSDIPVMFDIRHTNFQEREYRDGDVVRVIRGGHPEIPQMVRS